MAVEGSHDTNIYLFSEAGEFKLSGVQNFGSMNGSYQLGGSAYVINAASVDEFVAVPANRWFYTSLTQGSHRDFGYFEKDGTTWNFVFVTYTFSTLSSNKNTYVVTTTQGQINNPWELDLSNLTAGAAAFGGVFQNKNAAPIPLLKLNSIQNISFNQDVQETPALVVGQEISPTQIDGPTQTTVSVDKILNNNDLIRTFAGRSNISGQFEYGDNLLSFNKTCINNFSVNAIINELPQASFDFTIYGSLSGTSNSVSSTAGDDNAIEEITPEGLLVTFDKQSINAVQSFNYSEVFNKQATYGIGSSEPSDIQTVGPIIQEASIAIEVEDYEPEETFSFLSGSKDRNRTIKMEISGENSILNTFQLENGHLVSENVGVGVGGTIVANLKYRGYKKV